MEETQACRMCLSTSVKLNDMFKYRLHTAYETITGVEMAITDGLPPYACGVCSALLVKSATFKQMCDTSQNILRVAKLQQVLSTEYVRSLKITSPFSYTVKTNETIIVDFENEQDIKKENDSEPETDYKVKTESRESSIDSDRDDHEPLCNIMKKPRIIVEPLPRKVTRNTKADKPRKTAKEKPSPRTRQTATEKPKKTEKKEKTPKKSVAKSKTEKPIKEKKAKNKKEKETGYEFPEGEVEVILLTKEQQIEEIQARKTSVNYLSSFYKCDFCFKGFISESTYKNHMIRHDPSSGAISCEICQIRVASNKLLRSHMIQLHERKYVCKLCNNTSKSKHSASEHSKWHSGQKFICKFCDAVFSKKTSHLSHMRIHHPSEHANCDVCGEAFIGAHGLRMHKKKAHKNQETKTEPESETRCKNCKVQFQNADAFKRHINNITNELCDLNLRPCAKCGASFSTELDLKKHLKEHAKAERKKQKKVVKCEECNLTFGVARSYSLHYQQVHLRLPPAKYPCLLRPALAICDVCGKKCSVHTGEKPYPCAHCGKAFSLNYTRKAHIRTVHMGVPSGAAALPDVFYGASMHNDAC
ncbi:hypothetical protein ABMA27_012460 [Loxostege sticticalis]|uniref:Uncharacterized protein n=1 Tax=Loxostege sticticalis TaxID=481309 RepID=A0ABR3H1G0_LOXSC